MAMLLPERRHSGIIASVVLVLLMLGAVAPDPFSSTRPPKHTALAPSNFLSSAISYVDTAMGYAEFAPFLHSLIEYELGTSSSPKVYLGQNGHLYYGAERAGEQSAGLIYRASEVVRFAELSSVLSRELRRRGANLVITVPPNAQSIAIEDLPRLPKARPRLEYNLLFKELKKRGLAAVDLKSHFLAIGDGNSLYQKTDTHWTSRGAVIAFNQVMSNAKHPEWKVDVKDVLGPVKTVHAGDLARMLGLQRFLTDENADLLPSGNAKEWQPSQILHYSNPRPVFNSYSFERRGAKTTDRILVIGDSFTQHFWLPLLQRTDAAIIGWMHHLGCKFDFADVERFKPTLVILAPTERYARCSETNWPADLPRR